MKGRHEMLLYAIAICGVLALMFLLIRIPIQEESNFWKSQIQLLELDSFQLEVNVIKSDHGLFSFNGKYCLSSGDINYRILNGQRFEWGNLNPPFMIERKITSDTISIIQKGEEYLFLLEKQKDDKEFLFWKY